MKTYDSKVILDHKSYLCSMQSIKNYLTRSVPRKELKSGEIAKGLGIACAIIYLIFVLLEPFNFNITVSNKYLVILGFTLVYFITIFILLKWIFPWVNRLLKIQRWYFYHFLLGYFCLTTMVAIVHQMLQNLLNGQSVSSLSTTILHASFIGLIPAIILAFIFYITALKAALARGSNTDLNMALKAVEQEGYITFNTATGEKGFHRFEASSVLYLKAEDNYVNVVCLKNENREIEETLIRFTLKKATEKLALPFLRVHRSYIVNLNQVSKISGNTLGMQLLLRHSKQIIPVSRSYIPALKETIKSL